jgi:hypothetical protein
MTSCLQQKLRPHVERYQREPRMKALAYVLAILCLIAPHTGAEASLPRTGESKVSPTRLDKLTHGIIITDWLLWTNEKYQPNWYDDVIKGGDLKYLRDIGTKHIRLPIRGVSVDSDSTPSLLGPSLDPVYVKHLDDAIARITAAGMAVIIDVAQADSRPFIEGDAASEASFLQMWKNLSAHLSATDPENVMFEVYNEPVYLNNHTGWFDLQKQLVLEIRKNAPLHTLILTKPNWSDIGTNLSQFNPVSDTNVVYTFHYYHPGLFLGQGADGLLGAEMATFSGLAFPSNDANCQLMRVKYPLAPLRRFVDDYCSVINDAAVIDADIAKLYAWAKNYNVPVWLGEGGVFLAGTDDNSAGNWYAAFRAAMDKYRFGWGISTYDLSVSTTDDRHCMGICRKYDSSGNLTANKAVLAALGFDASIVGNVSAPTVPIGLSAVGTGASQATIKWVPSSDNVGVTEYKVYRNGALLGTSRSTSYIDYGAALSETYDYSVSACDADWNCSPISSSVASSRDATPLLQPVVGIKAGWNLVGNGTGSPLRVATFFGNSSRVQSVWKWIRKGATPGVVYPTWAFFTPQQADGGQAYAVSKGYEFLTVINGGEGFWVNALAPYSLQMPSGLPALSDTFQPGRSIHALRAGWNMVAIGETQTPNSFDNAISTTTAATGQIPPQLTSIWAWNPERSTWYFWAPTLANSSELETYIGEHGYLNFASMPATPLGTIPPGTGFWANVVTTVPPVLPVYRTSYENRHNAVLDNPTIPTPWEIPNMDFGSLVATPTRTGELGWSIRALAFADFAQEDSLTAIVLSPVWKNLYPEKNPSTVRMADSPAKLYFLRKNSSDGKWYDITSKLVKDISTRYACITPTFVEIADLNNDGKPDALISCTGLGFSVDPTQPQRDANEYQYLVLSQTDGTYKIGPLTTAGPIYGTRAALADIDGDGNIDILTIDQYSTRNPITLWGNGDGTFRRDVSRFPSDLHGKDISAIYAIPMNGMVNVFLSGNLATAFADNYSSNKYGFKQLQYMNGAFHVVTDLSQTIPRVTKTGLKYNSVQDIIHYDDSFYCYLVDRDSQHYAIVKIDTIAGTSTALVEDFLGTSPIGSGILRLTQNEVLVFQQSSCPQVPVPSDIYTYPRCMWKAKIN